jgi:hypothetical protein
VPRAALSRLGHAATWTGSFELSAALLRAEAHLQLGEAAAALEALTPVLGRSEAPPDLFALAALAVEGMGTPEPAFRDAARRFERRQWLEVRRMALLAGA